MKTEPEHTTATKPTIDPPIPAKEWAKTKSTYENLIEWHWSDERTPPNTDYLRWDEGIHTWVSESGTDEGDKTEDSVAFQWMFMPPAPGIRPFEWDSAGNRLEGGGRKGSVLTNG